MASVTTRPPDDPGLARVAPETIALPLPSASTTVRIEPPRGWFELHLHEVWQYRELLYFLVWRDVKVRYKQTVIGVAWVVLQPLIQHSFGFCAPASRAYPPYRRDTWRLSQYWLLLR
jgi:hypothetical protein